MAAAAAPVVKREDIETKLWASLEASQGKIADTQAWAKSQGVPHNDVLTGLLLSLSAEVGGPLTIAPFKREMWELTEDGIKVAEAGSPEHLLLASLPAAGLKKAELNRDAFNEAMKFKWIAYDKTTDMVTPVVDASKTADQTRQQLLEIRSGSRAPDKKEETILKRKKLVQFTSQTSYRVEQVGSKSSKKLVGDLTVEMLRDGSWKDVQFKEYNWAALGSAVSCGSVHPLSKMRQQFRQIFLELGFTEMVTDHYVESSFWNFDALFQPQQHPARDMHDTFFVTDPKFAHDNDVPTPAYRDHVRAMHEVGGLCAGAQSIGWRYPWSVEESQKNILRTHTTSSSARALYQIANQPGGFKPIKCFSIDRVFRNETLDATHLAEFHQVEGFIADYNIGLPHLISTFTDFFNKLGMRGLKFKPAFNPYTEPSMEIFAYHPGLGRTIEVGNSGVFRPEMLAPMGLPDNVQVIAWGLSLERPTMIMNNISSIRTLFGPSCSLDFIKNSTICRLETSEN